MNSRSPKLKSSALLLSLLGATPLAALATPPSSSPYVLDPQSVYVQDATSDGIANLNMVLCIMDAMRPADMVNQGAYIALVDKNKCDTKSQSSASNSTSGASGATSTPDYMTAVVDVTRASNADPMLANIWISMSENGSGNDIFVRLSAIQSPTDAPPYGQFRLDYIGKPASDHTTTLFNGFIDANGANVSYLETGANSSNDALALTATSTTAASGTMTSQDNSTQPPSPVTFNFAYDSNETSYPEGVFRRYDGTHDVCFDRSKANAQKSVWRYGVYNANDGTRVDQANPGFPVTATYGGNSYYGFASYWGINFQGVNLNGLADGPVVGAVITDQRPGNSSTYSLDKNGGKLTKWTKNQEALSAMDGVPFSFYGDLTGQTSNNAVTGFNNWQMQWNNGSGTFTVIGTQTCGNNGCVLTAISPVATVTSTTFDHAPISGWSNSFGGNINIPPTGATHTGSDPVNFYTQSDVIPGDVTAPSALYCLSQCPTAATIANFVSTGGPAPCNAFDMSGCSPFGNGTAFQWNSASGSANTVAYNFDIGGLNDNGTAIELTDPLLYASSQQFQNGIMTGKLFTAAFTNQNCPAGMPGTSVCEPADPDTYYTWQTGPNQWNQATWLTKTSDSSVVHFDPPVNIPYTVPSGTDYKTWADKSILLQFNGFGNLNGIPGNCVNPTDNSTVDCSVAGSRYVSMFSLPDGATMTLPSNSTPLIVKALNEELRLNKVGCSGTSLAQPSTSVPLPSASGVHDPSDAADADYIGVKPTVTDSPKVIDGVVQ